MGKVRVLVSKGRVVAGIAVKFVPCSRLLSEIQDNVSSLPESLIKTLSRASPQLDALSIQRVMFRLQMKKVTYNSRGLRMCLEQAMPREEDIEGKDNVYVTRDEIRTKVSLSFIH